MHYSPVDYYALGWVYPRDRLRMPFPRRRRKPVVALFGTVAPPPPSTGTPERTFLGTPRGTTFMATSRGVVFTASPRGDVFQPVINH